MQKDWLVWSSFCEADRRRFEGFVQPLICYAVQWPCSSMRSSGLPCNLSLWRASLPCQSRQMVLPVWPVAGLWLSTPVEERPWIAGVQGNPAVLDMAMSSTDNRLCTRPKLKTSPFLLPVSPDQVSWGLRVGKGWRWFWLVVSQQWWGTAGGSVHSWRSAVPRCSHHPCAAAHFLQPATVAADETPTSTWP